MFEYAPLYVPADLRKLILDFSRSVYGYLGCLIERDGYIRVLGVCRTLVKAERICLDDKTIKNQFNPVQYRVLKVEEGDVYGKGRMYSFRLYRDSLHEVLGGGIPKGTIVLIEGDYGAGKTILQNGWRIH